jgi:hypothetical protein
MTVYSDRCEADFAMSSATGIITTYFISLDACLMVNKGATYNFLPPVTTSAREPVER